jgi:hypothetical protein
LAPYELTLFSFLDPAGKEQDFTTTDPSLAQSHATQHGLMILQNRYEFVTSEPLPDPKGNRPTVVCRRRRAERVTATVNGPTREEVLALLSRAYHQRIGHDLDCPCLQGGQCLCLRSEIAQTLAAAGLQP